MSTQERIARLLHPDRWKRHDNGAEGHAHDCEIAESRALAERIAPLIERYEAALAPFAEYADPYNRVPDHLPITHGSNMGKRQLTMGDCYIAAGVLHR